MRMSVLNSWNSSSLLFVSALANEIVSQKFYENLFLFDYNVHSARTAGVLNFSSEKQSIEYNGPNERLD